LEETVFLNYQPISSILMRRLGRAASSLYIPDNGMDKVQAAHQDFPGEGLFSHKPARRDKPHPHCNWDRSADNPGLP